MAGVAQGVDRRRPSGIRHTGRRPVADRVVLVTALLLCTAGCTVNTIITAPQPTSTTTVVVTQTTTRTVVPSVSASSQEPADDAVPVPGTYSGLALQDSKSSKVWTVRIQFSPGHGVIEYTLQGTSRRCAGTVTERSDSTWLEHITQGTCDDRGTWSFRQTSSTSVHGEYQPPVGHYTVSADLSRQ